MSPRNINEDQGPEKEFAPENGFRTTYLIGALVLFAIGFMPAAINIAFMLF